MTARNKTIPAGTGIHVPAGLYIHIPFCIQKCRYCDFYSVTTQPLAKGFVAALIQEIKNTKPPPCPFDTLYIGGGTPSLLPPAAIEKIIQTARARFTLLPDTEITIEVNPGSVTPAHLRVYRRAGINRINIGVQSFRDDTLAFLGRSHTATEGLSAIEWATTAGFTNIGLDLIYGLPNQSLADWREQLNRALSLVPAHLSCYMLTFEPGTPLDLHRQNGSVQPLADEKTAEQFLLTDQALTEAGYDHYEISNFARGKTHRSRHNQKYWDHTPYLGFGPAAHSFLPPVRRWHKKNVRTYIERLENGKAPETESETLSKDQLMMEAIYLGLRQSDGICLNRFEKDFDIRFTEHFETPASEMVSQGLITLQNNRCAPTLQGMLYSDHIASRFC